ncbi:hypothetical protein [Mycolicibacterium farcinogenes]|uniref:hypothetical protein n=1 Tax=Mycolicibacterium farcinogenes TaxID=1802 RepID=UPI0028996325|nr:hypothetical protein [Mycolicibacterium farcinogenes]
MSPVRRRLLVYSAPVALVIVVVIVKLFSVVAAGNSAAAGFADRDAGALAEEVAQLERFNVVDPAKASFAAGALAVLQDRLADADRNFAEAAARSSAAESCSARVNLELVRETRGDRAAAASDHRSALGYYLAAREVVDRAPERVLCRQRRPRRGSAPRPQRRAGTLEPQDLRSRRRRPAQRATPATAAAGAAAGAGRHSTGATAQPARPRVR